MGGDELVTYDMGSIVWQLEHMGDDDMIDNDRRRSWVLPCPALRLWRGRGVFDCLADRATRPTPTHLPSSLRNHRGERPVAVRRPRFRDGDLCEESAAAPTGPQPAFGRFAPILGLQQQAGNAAVSRLVAQRAADAAANGDDAGEPDTAGASFDVAISGDRDGEQGTEHGAEVDPQQVTDALSSGLAEPEEVPEGGEISLPDMTMPETGADDTDAVTASVDFSTTITNSGTVNPFGSTSWATFNVTDIKVKKKKASYAATFKVRNPITYNVSSPKTSIASATDPALTQANYARAASDLTPDTSDLGGRPPRTQFWAKDLTLRHEKFHSAERKRLNTAGAKQAKTWLASQTASSATDVQALIAQVPAKIIAASQAAVGTLEQKEARAYGDGIPSYKARAKAITKRGGAGKYT